MADTERLINKAQGDSIISAIQGITARLQEMYTVDDAMSSSSENPVQNKVITEALNGKVDAVTGKGLSTNDYTNEEKASVANSAEQLESTQTATGNPLTLTDCAPINAESLVVELEPKQDLHGYDFPWVGGAGKNKLELNKADFSETGVTVTFDKDKGTAKLNGTNSYGVYFRLIDTFTTSLTGAAVISMFIPSAVSDAYLGYDAVSGNGSRVELTPNSDGYVEISVNEISNILRIWIYLDREGIVFDNYIMRPMLRLATESDPTFAPWENICPITGYTECEVDDVGKNRFDETNYYDLYTNYEYTENTYRCKKIQLKANTTYTITQRATVTSNVVLLLNIDIHVNGTGYFDCRKAGDSKTYTTGEDGYLYIGTLGNDADTNARLKECKIQIEEGSTATEYEPFQSSNATIQFGQTVYGGKSDFVEGGTSDEFASVDLGTLSWTYRGDGVFSAAFTDYLYKEDVYALCSGYNYLGTVSGFSLVTENGGIYLYYNPALSGGVIYVKDNQFSDATAFTEKVSGIMFVYEKATPATISTPPTELKLLKGTNNLSTNGTTITLGYQPDNVIGEVKGEIEAITEMDYLRILDNNVDTPINNYRIYYHLISGAYTLVNMAEMLNHRFIFVEVIKNPSGGVNKKVLHSALIDPRTIDGFEYEMKASGNDTIWIESILDENKFNLSLRTTGGSYSDGDPTDYYVTIRMVD